MKTNNRIVIAIAFLFIGLTSVNASPFKGWPDLPVELKYAGNIENNPVFHLNINATDNNSSFVVSISDRHGVTLYRENLGKGNFTRNFMLNKDELGNEPLTVEIINRQDKKVVVFEINSESRTLVENHVTRVR